MDSVNPTPPTAERAAPPPADAGRAARLVALDIDGTLLDDRQQLAPAVRTAVVEVSAHTHVVLATGRCTVSTRQIADRLGLANGYAVCSNGAVVARLGSFEPVTVATFDPAPAVRLLLDHMPDALIAVEELGVGYRVNAPFPPGDLSGLQRIEPVDSLVAHPAPRVVVNRPGWSARSLHDVLAGAGLRGVTYAVGSTAWLDLAPEGVTKAAALETVRTWLEVPPTETAAFGDGRNDIEMLRWAHRGYAMADAPPEVQAAADTVIGSVHDAAVATELARHYAPLPQP